MGLITSNASGGEFCQHCGSRTDWDSLVLPAIPSAAAPDIFTTNRVPTPFEMETVRAAIPATDTAIAQVHADIDRLRTAMQNRGNCPCRDDAWKALSRAFVRRSELEQRRHMCAEIGGSALIRGFPPELLSEIFLLNAASEHSPSIGSFSGQRPLRLSQVCRRWREIALSTPRLWSTLTLSPRRGSVESYRALVFMWLERSRQCPLSLSVGIRPLAASSHSVFQPLTLHSPRWENLTYTPGVEELDGITGHLPNLRSLRFLPGLADPSDNDERAAVISRATAPFQVSPRLQRLRLPTMFLSQDAVFPWDQITVLTVDFVDLTNIQFVLRHLPNLQHCTLHQTETIINYDFDPIRTTPPHHSRLESLDLRLKGAGVLLFFPIVTLPNLKALTIETADPRVPHHDLVGHNFGLSLAWTRSSMISFLVPPTRGGIQRLRVYAHYPRATLDTVCCLQDAPSVVELELATFDTALFQRLTRSGNIDAEPDVAPKLRRLTVDPRISGHWNKAYDALDYGAFVAMLDSRAPVAGPVLAQNPSAAVVTCLEDVVLYLYSPPPAETIADLRRIKGSGVHVALFCDGEDLLR
ncbi:hypothetical protein PLICRDRAFT_659327 [Plicaturopsis crispa FD-325 SS-3]|nr:hypothetical protein PLICRDRAFT_659327 [Plicaturopsis crispa FD-325 SS-3]